MHGEWQYYYVTTWARYDHALASSPSHTAQPFPPSLSAHIPLETQTPGKP